MQTLIIPGEMPGLNTIIAESKKHWSNYAHSKKKYTLIAMVFAKRDLVPITKPVSLTFTWYCKNKRRDPDNIASAKKYIIDGLVDAKILSEDGWKQIEEFRDRFRIDKDNPRIEVIIYEEKN